jgi:hypothetical protein
VTQQATTGVTDLAWTVVGTGDFDGDGKSDILWRNANNGRNAIWSSGNAATQQATTDVTDLVWKVVGTGDFDGDGKADILWRNASGGQNAIWKSGNSATPQAMTDVTDLAWTVVGTGDFGAGITIMAVGSPLQSIANVSVTEGNSGTRMATFTVQLSQPSSSEVRYNIATADGTAIAGADYEASGLVAEDIPAGSTSKAFTVTINGDTTYEANETFTVNVSNVVGATISDGQAIGTIIDDDSPYGY